MDGPNGRRYFGRQAKLFLIKPGSRDPRVEQVRLGMYQRTRTFRPNGMLQKMTRIMRRISHDLIRSMLGVSFLKELYLPSRRLRDQSATDDWFAYGHLERCLESRWGTLFSRLGLRLCLLVQAFYFARCCWSSGPPFPYLG